MRSTSETPYERGWSIARGEPSSVRAEGILGQFLYVSPDRGTVVVRQGSSLGRYSCSGWLEAFDRIAADAAAREGCFAANAGSR